MPKTISNSRISKGNNKIKIQNFPSKNRVLYLSSYFDRNPQQSYSSLSVSEQEDLLNRLKLEYSQILFDYFSSDDKIARLIDCFVKEVFLVDLPVHKVVEIHCLLIDELKRQLMIKGLHTEHLCSFRLTLIEVIARLGETYRKAIHT